MQPQDTLFKGVGKADEIAKMAQFLIDDNSSWITAQTITIDGGIGSIKS